MKVVIFTLFGRITSNYRLADGLEPTAIAVIIEPRASFSQPPVWCCLAARWISQVIGRTNCGGILRSVFPMAWSSAGTPASGSLRTAWAPSLRARSGPDFAYCRYAPREDTQSAARSPSRRLAATPRSTRSGQDLSERSDCQVGLRREHRYGLPHSQRFRPALCCMGFSGRNTRHTCGGNGTCITHAWKGRARRAARRLDSPIRRGTSGA